MEGEELQHKERLEQLKNMKLARENGEEDMQPEQDHFKNTTIDQGHVGSIQNNSSENDGKDINIPKQP